MPNQIGAPISIEEANQFIDNHIQGYFDPGHYPVKSFIFDAGLLRDYLNQNLDIQNMKFMLAAKPDEGGVNTPNLVIVGYDAQGNYVKTANNEVLDHCQPCPYNCPTIGPASHDHIS